MAKKTEKIYVISDKFGPLYYAKTHSDIEAFIEVQAKVDNVKIITKKQCNSWSGDLVCEGKSSVVINGQTTYYYSIMSFDYIPNVRTAINSGLQVLEERKKNALKKKPKKNKKEEYQGH